MRQNEKLVWLNPMGIDGEYPLESKEMWAVSLGARGAALCHWAQTGHSSAPPGTEQHSLMGVMGK